MVMPPPVPPVPPTPPDQPPLFDLPGKLLDTGAPVPVPRSRSRPRPRKKPDLSQVQQRIEKAVSFWSARDDRMDEDEQLYRLSINVAGVVPTEGLEDALVVRNLPYVTVEKIAAIVGSEWPRFSVVSPSESLLRQAEEVEELLRFLWREWDRQWRSSLHSGLLRDAAHFLALRGWVAVRLSYNEQEEIPVRVELVDPRAVYPLPGSTGLRYVAVRRKVTVSEVFDYWPDRAVEVLGDREDDEVVDLEAYYDEVYHAVLVEGRFLQEPEEHGLPFCPWVIAVAGGSPIRASEVNSQDWTAHVGVSAFHGVKQLYRQMNRVLTQLATEVARIANPPVLFYFDPLEGDEPRELDLSPGAVNVLIAPKERVELIRTSPNPSDLGPLLSVLREDIDRGSLPGVLWGAVGPETSGFAIAQLSRSAKESLAPVLLAMEQMVADVSSKALQILGEVHRRPVGMVVRDSRGRWVAGKAVTPETLEQVGYRVEVAYRDVTPQDRGAMAQVAALLTDRKLVSLRTAREEYLGIDNPDLENDRVLEELIYLDQETVRDYLVPLALARFSPELFQIWFARQMREREAARAQQAAGQTGGRVPPGGPPGPPPGPPPGAPHPGAPPAPGIPPQPAPPQFGPDVNEMINLIAQASGAATRQ